MFFLSLMWWIALGPARLSNFRILYNKQVKKFAYLKSTTKPGWKFAAGWSS